MFGGRPVCSAAMEVSSQAAATILTGPATERGAADPAPQDAGRPPRRRLAHPTGRRVQRLDQSTTLSRICQQRTAPLFTVVVGAGSSWDRPCSTFKTTKSLIRTGSRSLPTPAGSSATTAGIIMLFPRSYADAGMALSVSCRPVHTGGRGRAGMSMSCSSTSSSLSLRSAPAAACVTREED